MDEKKLAGLITRLAKGLMEEGCENCGCDECAEDEQDAEVGCSECAEEEYEEEYEDRSDEPGYDPDCIEYSDTSITAKDGKRIRLTAREKEGAFVDQPVPWDEETENALEKERDDAYAKLEKQLDMVKGRYYWSPGRSAMINMTLTGRPLFHHFKMGGLWGLTYRDGVLTVDPEWVSERESLPSYGWAKAVDKMIRLVKSSPKIVDGIDEVLDKAEKKFGYEIDRKVRDDIKKWCLKVAKGRLGMKAMRPKGKEFVINEELANKSASEKVARTPAIGDSIRFTGPDGLTTVDTIFDVYGTEVETKQTEQNFAIRDLRWKGRFWKVGSDRTASDETERVRLTTRGYKSAAEMREGYGLGDPIDLTQEQECENWMRDFLQARGGALVRGSEILSVGERFGYDRAMLTRALKTFVKEKYVAKQGSSYKWIEVFASVNREARKVTQATIKSILRKIGANPDEYEMNRDNVVFWGSGEDHFDKVDRAEKLAAAFEKALEKAGGAWKEVTGAGSQVIVYWRDMPEDMGDWGDKGSRWHY